MWKFGLQTKSAGRNKVEIENTETFIILKYKIFELTNIPPEKQILKTGRPPAIILVENEDVQIKDVGKQLQNMDLIIVDESNTASSTLPPPKRMKTSPVPFENSSTQNSVDTNPRAFSAKIEPQNSSSYEGVIKRKVVPADNSCLFASILHCIKPTLLKVNKRLNSMDLRYICSEYVKDDAQRNNGTHLMDSIIAESDGKIKNPAEYSKRILDSNSWGGYVECKILSEYFQVQIVAGNVEIGTFNKYPDDNSRFGARIYILYDGIHYDACEKGNGKSVFFCNDTCQEYSEVTMFLLELKEKKAYTNTSTCRLYCNECHTNLQGEKEAQAHAKLTGHINFVQKSCS